MSEEILKVITSYQKYMDRIFNSQNPDNEDVKKALEIAIDNRQREIDRRYDRMNYFWVISALILTGLGFLWHESLKSDVVGTVLNINGNVDISGNLNLLGGEKQSSNVYYLISALSFIGIFIGYIWVYVEKVSHFFQNNWERHVDFLTDILGYKIHTTLFLEEDSGYKRYSFGRMHRTSIWFLIFIYNVSFIISLYDVIKDNLLYIYIFLILVNIIFKIIKCYKLECRCCNFKSFKCIKSLFPRFIKKIIKEIIVLITNPFYFLYASLGFYFDKSDKINAIKVVDTPTFYYFEEKTK